MRITDYLHQLQDRSLICDSYARKVFAASTKTSMLNIGLDVNGIDFLASMSTFENKPDYALIEKEFGRYANGRFVRRDRYTSSFYLFNKEKVEISTNITLFMQCNCDVEVRDYDCVSLYVDSGSVINILMGEHSSVKIHRYGDAEILYDKNFENNITLKYGRRR